MYFGAARCCRRVGVDMTEVDVVTLQLITAARLATSATAAGPTAASAAGGGGAAGSHAAAIVDVIGGCDGRLHFFGGTKQNAVGLIIETTMCGKW